VRGFRLVFLRNPDGIETKHVERFDSKEIEEALGDERVIGIFIGKE